MLIDRYRRLTLRAKLALHVSFGISVIVVVLVSVSLLSLRRDIAETATAAQSALVRGVVRDLEDKLALRRSALGLESAALGQRAAMTDARALADFFEGRPLLASLFDELLLADASGAVVYNATTRTTPVGRSIADRGYFRAALQTGEATTSPPLAAKSNGKPVIAIATPVFDRRGEATGVMVGVLHLYGTNFVADVARQRIGERGYLALLTQDDPAIVIAHPQPGQLMRAATTGAGRRNVSETVAGLDGAGTDVLLSRGPLASVPWVVEAVYPTAEAFASLRLRQRQVLGIGLGAALMSGLMVWLLTTRLLAPMGQLRRALELDATGSEDLLQAIPADSADVAALLQTYYQQKSRRQALEQAVATSERRLRSITDNLPAIIGYVDCTETYRFANAHHRHVYGIDPAGLVGQTLEASLGADSYADLKPHIDAALRGARQKFERAGWTGTTHAHFIVEYVPEIDPEGRVAGFFIMKLDITERRQAELSLAQSEQRIRAITDNVPVMISHFDRDLRYTFANAEVGRVFGRDAAGLIGRSIREVRGEAVFADVAHRMARALAGEQMAYQASSTTPDGKLQHFEANYIPEIDPSGQVLGFYALTFEVTQRKAAEEKLRASEKLLDRTGRIAGVGGWEIDIPSGAITWTEQTRRIHEVGDDYVPVLEEAIDFYVGDARQTIERVVQEALASGTPWDVELPFMTARGRSIWVRSTGEVEFEQGKAVRMFGAFQDVSQRIAQERQLREQADLLHVTLESIGDGVITADEAGRVRWMNPVAERMTGCSNDAARGKPLASVFNVIHADTRAPAPDRFEASIAATGAFKPSDRGVLVSASGEEFAVEDSASPIRDADGRVLGAVLVFHDVSEQRRLSDALTHRATHDALTGLINRAEFETRLGRVLTRMHDSADTSALMFIDLDHFKLVNDACGHAMGDKLLCQVSALMTRCVRHRDTLARLGGDEFGIILEHCTVEQARRVAQSLCDQLDEFRFVHEGRHFKIGASIGLVPIDLRWAGPAALKQAADTACYAAKEGGRNRVHVWFDTEQALRTRDGDTPWASRLEGALENDGFALFAQRIEPIRSASGGLRLEVLLRLREADGTLVEASRFLPAAERFQIASRIDRWVLGKVLEWLGAQRGALQDVESISVNLSGQSIGERAFHRDAVQALRAWPVEARKLCFEVPESAAVANLQEASAFFEAARSCGAAIALDDFGAGSSSFGYLKQLPVDCLKIDGQFIPRLQDDPLDIAAVRCFHEVARALGISTVAKRVETDATLSRLRDIGIDFAQGFLLHRPEPLETLVARARERTQSTPLLAA